MRKIIICFLVLLFTSFTFAQNSGSVELDLAISNSVRDIRSTLPAASVVAVYNFDSPSDSLSKYIANQMIQNISNNTSLRVVERDSQKRIIIGKNGDMIKEIKNKSLNDIKKLLGSKVHLELWVKVKKDWKDRPNDLRALGYSDDEL